MDKRIIIVYRIFALVACSIFLFYAINSKEHLPEKMYPAHTDLVITPTSENINANGVYIAEFDSNPIVNAGGCLSFPTTFMDVWVYIDGVPVYENVGPRTPLMKSNGKVWHFISVNEDNKNILVEVKPVYDGGKFNSPDYVAGDFYDIKAGIVVGSSIPLVISLLDIICGVILLVHFSRKRVQKLANFQMVFFGTTALLIGA